MKENVPPITDFTGEYPIKVFSQYNHDCGLAMLVGGVPIIASVLFGFLPFFEPSFDPAPWWWIPAAWAIAAIIIMRRKETFVISTIRVRWQAAFWLPEMTLSVAKTSYVELNCFMFSEAGLRSSWWDVKLVSPTGGYRVAVKREAHLEMRNLAEFMSRTIGKPFIDRSSRQARPVLIPPEDLDLSFKERVRKYPDYMGRRMPHPSHCKIQDERVPPDIRFFVWSGGTLGMVRAVLFWVALLTGAAFIPYGNGHSLYQRFGLHLLYPYLITLGALGLLTMLYRACFTYVVKMDGKELTHQVSFMRIPVLHEVLPTDKIEQVQTVNEIYVHVVSDQKIVALRTYELWGQDQANAMWLAYEIQRELAGPRMPISL